MKKILFIVLIYFVSAQARAGLIYCEFAIFGVTPFVETRNDYTDGVLGAEITVTREGKSGIFPLVSNEAGSGEKLKFTIADGNPEGEVYITIFDEAGSIDGSFKSMISNPAVTIPILKDVPGYCLIEQ